MDRHSYRQIKALTLHATYACCAVCQIKFMLTPVEANLPNLIPANISGYTVFQGFLCIQMAHTTHGVMFPVLDLRKQPKWKVSGNLFISILTVLHLQLSEGILLAVGINTSLLVLKSVICSELQLDTEIGER